MRVDLHCHSTASDGVLAPAALVQRAHEKGVGLPPRPMAANA